MSKRTTILIASTIVFLLVVAVVKFRHYIPFLGSMRPDDTLSHRPERSDSALMKQFEGEYMQEILSALIEAADEDDSISQKTTASTLLESLPDAPLPYTSDTKPIDAGALRGFVASIQQGQLGEPTLLDRWRFNLAAAALQLDKKKVPASLYLKTQPETWTENFPVRMRPATHEPDLKGPVAIGDFDGKEGLEIVSHGGSRLSKVRPDGSTVPLNSLDQFLPGNGLYPADFDHDGDLDLLVTRQKGFPDSLLRNQGGGRFEDVTIELGLLSFRSTLTAAWLDYDHDGNLDLALGYQGQPLELYRQTSGGTLQPVAWDLNIGISRDVVGIQVADINADGFADLYLSIKGEDDRLLITTPALEWQDWRFVDVAPASQIVGSRSGSKAAFFDFDNDGDQDLLLGDPAASGEALQVEYLVHPTGKLPKALRLYQNRGDGVFDEITDEVSLGGVQDVQSIGIADLDEDGYEDIIIGSGQLAVNRDFWNRGALDFRDISVSSGLSYLDGTGGIVSGDLDGDGARDLLLQNRRGKIRWLEGEGGEGAWLRVELRGGQPGTRVALVVRDKDWVLHTVQQTMGAVPNLDFGLGDAEIVESIQVYAPSGTEPVKTLEKQKTNQNLLIYVPQTPAEKSSPVPVAGANMK